MVSNIYLVLLRRLLQCTAISWYSSSISTTRHDNYVHNTSTIKSIVCHVPSGTAIGWGASRVYGTPNSSIGLFRKVSKEHWTTKHKTINTHAKFVHYSNGYNCPASFNPADFLIGVLATSPGSEKASQRAATRLCDLFAVSDEGRRVEMLVNLEMSMAESDEPRKVQNTQFQKPFWLITVYWLVYRNFLNVLRDPSVQTLRFIQKLVRHTCRHAMI